MLKRLEREKLAWMLGGAAVVALPAAAMAQTVGSSQTLAGTTSALLADAVAYLPQSTANILWLCLTAFLVFFMQAGFAMVESGLTRSKNAANIMMKNLMDFSFGAILFWALGYSLMYGTDIGGFIGFSQGLVFLPGGPTSSGAAGSTAADSAAWIFQVVFAATAATIVSGAMAERTKLIGYVAYSIIISALIYPITGHWIWGGGWLSNMGMRDFAGSTVVHSVGAWAALAGAIVIGPRIGKFNKDGSPNAIPGHNMPLAALGVFILWFGWYGFNPGSTLTAVDGVAHIAVTTTLGAAGGAVAALITSWFSYGKPDPSMSLNGALAGLVAITAPCASVTTWAALVIGLVAGVLVFFAVLFIERVLKIDDPVGAVSVHGVCGAWGTISIGLFGSRAVDLPYWDKASAIQNGVFYGGGVHQLGVQVVGVLAVMGFTLAVAFPLFLAIKYTIGLRASDEEQIEGLDLGEHDMTSYPDFQQTYIKSYHTREM